MGSGSGIIFKGSGFYETDYKDKKGTPPKKEASKAAASSDKSDGKGPEKKSDAGKTTTDAKGTAKAAASKD